MRLHHAGCAMANRVKPKYPGILNKPIVLAPPPGGLLTPLTHEDWAQYEKSIIDQHLRRRVALFAHYGITPDAPNCWRDLALRLAKDNVPGFRVQHRGRGRIKRPGGPFADLHLCMDILRLSGARKFSVQRACELLSKRETYKGSKAGTLRRRFHAADSRVRHTARLAVLGELIATAAGDASIQSCAEFLAE